MNTPICDFIKNYVKEDKLRLHMPGHKGKAQLGFEAFDITEISGADSLYHADGIIKESESNATSIFESGATFFSTEGSSHCIRAMLYLAKTYATDTDGYVLAGRNAHSSFISACALNDVDVEWLYPSRGESYLSCTVTAEKLENALSSVDKTPICVYVTSPDYLGNMCDVASLSEVCHRHGTLLLVDNAHGAYLKFLEKDMHPISLGADLVCDSAHKTLPVLTGGAYLHVSKEAPDFFKASAKDALSLFGSTSPSYLTLASLDNANRYMNGGFGKKLKEFTAELCRRVKGSELCVPSHSSPIREPLKIVFEPKKFGYRGGDFAKILYENDVVCEFYDDDYLVLMPSLENGYEELDKLFSIINATEVREPIFEETATLIPPKKAMSPRLAVYSQKERVSIDEALGRILATSCVSCPPAVSLIVCGEEFNESVIELCKKYGFSSFDVVKN